MRTIHSSPTHHPSSQMSIHPSPTIYFLSIIMNYPLSIYLSSIPYPSIYLSSIHLFHQPASYCYSICLSTYHISITHLSTIHQSLIAIHHLSCIHQFFVHPLSMHLFIYLFLTHPPITPFIIYLLTISHALSIHLTYVPHPFLRLYLSFTSQS